MRALTEWYKLYAEKEMKDVYFCMAISHDPGTFHSKTSPIRDLVPRVEPPEITASERCSPSARIAPAGMTGKPSHAMWMVLVSR
jgi:hypothetical protein